jgi:hypothetical protein
MTDENPRRIPFNPPAWTGHPIHIGDLWKLTTGDRVAVCSFWNHPLGAEIRCDVDGEMQQTKAGRELAALLDESDAWKRAFPEKGWR